MAGLDYTLVLKQLPFLVCVSMLGVFLLPPGFGYMLIPKEGSVPL